MNDLLASDPELGRAGYGGDLEAGVSRPAVVGAPQNAEKNLAEFFKEVEKIKKEMEKVRELRQKLQSANEEGKSMHKAQALKALRERMEKDVEKTLTIAKNIKIELERLDRSNEKNRKIPGFEEGTPTDRSRTSVTNALKKKLQELMSDFQNLRQQIMGEYKETIERRYFTVTGKKADEEVIDRIIETGESETFLQKAIREQGRGHVIETIREIQERHDAVKELEKNLLDLHQIFLDVAVLVDTQGEQLDNIEVNVNKASAFIETGTTQLRSAKKHQRSKRKWMCIALIILLIVLVVVLVPTLTKLLKNNKSA